MRLYLLLTLSLAFAGLASAGDLTGTWKAQWEFPNRKVEMTYSLKQVDKTLTGAMQGGQSPSIDISEGKVTGDQVSFVLSTPGGEMKFAHEGKIKGDEIEFTVKPYNDFPGMVVVAKRAKP
jgi:hypothetical protein